MQIRRTAARELEVVQSLHHINLVSFLQSFRANGKLHLVFEFMDRTLLHDMELMPHGIPYETVESYMFQLAQAVHFLHQNKVRSSPYKLIQDWLCRPVNLAVYTWLVMCKLCTKVCVVYYLNTLRM